MTIMTTKTAIIAAIEEIRTTGKKLDQMIWVAAVSVIAHNDKHGDITLTNTLIEAMPKGSRVNALLAYLEFFGKMSWDAEAKAMKHDKNQGSDIVGAQSTSWVEFKPEPVYQAMTIEGAVASLIKKANERVILGDERDNINALRLDALANLMNGWEMADAHNAKAVAKAEAIVDALAGPLADTIETALAA